MPRTLKKSILFRIIAITLLAFPWIHQTVHHEESAIQYYIAPEEVINVYHMPLGGCGLDWLEEFKLELEGAEDFKLELEGAEEDDAEEEDKEEDAEKDKEREEKKEE